MKQKIYYLGIISAMIIVAGTLFKVNHWPAAGILLTAGTIFMIAGFLPSALINHFKAKGNKQTWILYIVTYVTCLLIFSAMLFKIMHWPFAGVLIFIAVPFPFVVFLPVWLYVTSRIENFDINNTIFILFLLMAQAVFSVFLALNVSKEKFENTLQLTIPLYSMNSKSEALQSFESGSDINLAAQDLLYRIDECRELLSGYTGTTRAELNSGTITGRYLDSRNIAPKILLNEGNSSPALILEASLRKFVDELVKLPAFHGEKEKITDLFNLIDNTGENVSWTERMFMGNYLTWNLVELDAMENSVRVLMMTIDPYTLQSSQ
jgi:hypothetical protein